MATEVSAQSPVEQPIPRIALFLATTVLLTAFFWWLTWLVASGQWKFGPPETRQLFVAGLMWCPGIAALLVCWFTRKPLTELGFELPRWKYLAMGFGYPLLAIAFGYIAIWLCGFGALDVDAYAASIARRFTLPEASVALRVAIGVAVTLSVGMLAEMGRSLGEEIGWRGFLVGEMLKRHGLTVAGLASGFIWALWHFPIFIAQGYWDVPMWYALGCFTVMVTATGYVAAWLRLYSGSLWPVVVLHSIHNATIYPLFEAMTRPVDDVTIYFSGEMGIALAVTYALTAAMLAWRVRSGRSR